MSKEEIALQLILKILEINYEFFGLSAAVGRNDILDINAKNISSFFNTIVNELNVSDNN